MVFPSRELHFVYKAGPYGYDIFRSLTDKGFDCAMASPVTYTQESR
jgi:transposase